MYIGYKRDNTRSGNGSILCNIYLPESEFKSPYYTECYVRFEGVEDMDGFSEDYKNKVNKLDEQPFEVSRESVNQRFDKQLSMAKRDIDLANKQLELLKGI